MTGFWARFKRFLPEGGFARNVAVLAGGSALGQGLVVLASPLLTRLYTPQDFGVLAVYVALITILSTVVSFRYELAIPLPSEEEEARTLLQLSLFFVLVLGGLLMLLVYLWGEIAAHWMNVQVLAPYLWLLPVGAILVGIYQALTYWAVRTQDYGGVAQTKVRQGVGSVLAQVGLGWMGLGPLGLLIGDVVGRAAGIVLLARRVSDLCVWPSWRVLYRVALRYGKFPLFSMSSTLINRLGLQLPHLLLASLYGPQVAGWYMLVQRVMGLPSNLVGQAVAQVYLGEGSRLKREDPKALRSLYVNAVKKLFLMGALPIATAGLVGSALFATLFGPDWVMAGKYLLLLTPMFTIQLVIFPLSQTLIILERQELQFVWDLLRLALVLASLQGAAALTWNSLWAIGALSLAMTVAYLLLGIMGVLAVQREKS